MILSFSLFLGGSLAKFLMIEPDRTGLEEPVHRLEEPVPGTEIDRNLPSTACSRRRGNHLHIARIPLGL
jgi:hypothetical protein